jgi:hypothetical protein
MSGGAIRTWRDAARLASAVLALRSLEGSLRRRGFAVTHERARSAALVQRAGAEARFPGPREAERLADLVALAARIARARCLPRSLLLYSWLARDGAPVQLCIGVRRLPGGLRAHAWVEWTSPDGASMPLGESANVRSDFALLRGGLAEAPLELDTSDFAGS